tara:strand:- start:361 stop:801 length:441 start_codon:yes stop_codon:yes gene_type:complete
MRNTLDSLLKSANAHHEEARIAAIDAASVLEEEWTDRNTEKDNLEEESVGLKSECETADTYLKRYEDNATVQMVKKATDDSKVETLVEDNEKITETLTKLRNLKERLGEQRIQMETQLVEKTKQCTVLKERLAAAEQRVETITGFT